MAARLARRIHGVAAALAKTPESAFTAASAPPRPDYSTQGAWAALPGPSSHKPADCFYLHPTAYFGASWNARFDDAAASLQVDELHVGVQAAAFGETCRVFAPRYRQMTYTGFVTSDADSARGAADLAYSDVARAFDFFLQASGNCVVFTGEI